MRYLRAFVLGAIVVLTVFLSVALAQVRYKDDEGVLHWVDSMDQVPPHYRSGAVGHAGPKGAPAGADYERQLRQSGNDRARAALVDDCAARLIVEVPAQVPIENTARRNAWLPDYCHGISLEEMREANLRRR